MKKILGFVLVALVIVVAGCNKDKMYTKDLTGTWQVYKHLYKNVDETAQFLSITDTAFYGYRITFNGTNIFSEKHIENIQPVTVNGSTYNDTTFVINGGTYAFANNYNNLILTDSTLVFNSADSLLVPTLRTRTYTIFDLTGSSVQLDTDTTQDYFSKNTSSTGY